MVERTRQTKKQHLLDSRFLGIHEPPSAHFPTGGSFAAPDTPTGAPNPTHPDHGHGFMRTQQRPCMPLFQATHTHTLSLSLTHTHIISKTYVLTARLRPAHSHGHVHTHKQQDTKSQGWLVTK